MPARLSRHVLATGAATCALVLGAATPVIARPAPHPPPPGGHDARSDPSIQTSSLAGTTEWNVGAASTSSSPAAEISAPDDGATTLAVVLIAGGALAAGAGAGFAGGRRVALRLH